MFVLTRVIGVEPMPPPDAVPEELPVEGVGLLEEGEVARVLVHLPRPLHVGDGGGAVHARHPQHAEVVGERGVFPR